MIVVEGNSTVVSLAGEECVHTAEVASTRVWERKVGLQGSR